MNPIFTILSLLLSLAFFGFFGYVVFLFIYEVLFLRCVYGKYQTFFIKLGWKFLFKEYITRWPKLGLDEETLYLLITLAKKNERHRKLLIVYKHPIPEEGIKRFFENFHLNEDSDFIGRFLRESPRINEILGWLIEHPSKESMELIISWYKQKWKSDVLMFWRLLQPCSV